MFLGGATVGTTGALVYANLWEPLSLFPASIFALVCAAVAFGVGRGADARTETNREQQQSAGSEEPQGAAAVTASTSLLSRMDSAQSLLEFVENLSEREILKAGKDVSDIYRVCLQHVEELDSNRTSFTRLFETADEFSRRLIMLTNEFESLVQKQMGFVEAATTATDRITQSARMIKKVARESTMLGLNATIEAARAGEAGEGFSIIARQLCELTNTVAEANDAIASRTGSLREVLPEITVTAEELLAHCANLQSDVSEQNSDFEQAHGELMQAVSAGIGGGREISARANNLTMHLQFQDRMAQSLAKVRSLLEEQVLEAIGDTTMQQDAAQASQMDAQADAAPVESASSPNEKDDLSPGDIDFF
jgi:methyl-accepting chemotaxis protein